MLVMFFVVKWKTKNSRKPYWGSLPCRICYNHGIDTVDGVLANKDEFSEEELKVFDRFVPYFIYTFTETVNWTDGLGMKLIKIHLLHHFSTMIHLFGCAKNLIHLFQKKTQVKSQGTCKENKISID